MYGQIFNGPQLIKTLEKLNKFLGKHEIKLTPLQSEKSEDEENKPKISDEKDPKKLFKIKQNIEGFDNKLAKTLNNRELTGITLQTFKNLVEKNLQFFHGIPLPAEVEISESGTCNRTCSFCPRSAPGFEDKKEFLKTELFEKLCKELSGVLYSGTIRFSGFVEPLLDKNIFNLISIARKYLKTSNIEMVTNGDVLNVKDGLSADLMILPESPLSDLRALQKPLEIYARGTAVLSS